MRLLYFDRRRRYLLNRSLAGTIGSSCLAPCSRQDLDSRILTWLPVSCFGRRLRMRRLGLFTLWRSRLRRQAGGSHVRMMKKKGIRTSCTYLNGMKPPSRRPFVNFFAQGRASSFLRPEICLASSSSISTELGSVIMKRQRKSWTYHSPTCSASASWSHRRCGRCRCGRWEHTKVPWSPFGLEAVPLDAGDSGLPKRFK